MSMDRFGDKVCCNPAVKLKKQKSYPVIDIDKITPGYKTVRSVESVEYTGQGGSKFQDHDVLFARITPCLENGKMAIADTDGQNGLGSTELFVFRGINGVSDTDYVYYLLRMKHIRQLAANSMTGASGRQRADMDFIKRIQWDFPDVETQKKIASVLSEYDNLIEVNNKRIKVLEQMAENLYKEWFVRFRFPGHETSEFENGLPKGWRIEKLNAIADFQYGKIPLQEHIVDNGYPIFTGYRTSGFYDSYMYEKPMLLVVARGVGGTGDVKISPAKAFITNLSIVFLLKNPELLMHYLYQLFQLQNLRYLDSGAAQSQITIEDLQRVRIILPDSHILMKYNNAYLPISNEILLLEEKNINLIKQRDLLLTDAPSHYIAVQSSARNESLCPRPA